MNLRPYVTRGEVRSNEGSLARDHLANERTFLSWVRTALAFIGLGVLVAELVESEGIAAEVLGLALIFLGGTTAVASTSRYLRVTRQLDDGRYQSSGMGPVIVGGLTLLVAFGGLYFALS